MKKVTRQFSTMLDFEKITVRYGRIKDYSRLTVKGYIEEADIELAKAGFNAIVIEGEPE
jgi:hypothetical protein